MKRLLAVLMVLGLAATANAQVDILGEHVDILGLDLREAFVSTGVAYYQDRYDEDIALYGQVAVGSLFSRKLFIGCGVTVPLNHTERTRPHFSVHTTPNRIFGGGWRINPQVGVFVGMSPYRSWGIQAGLAF